MGLVTGLGIYVLTLYSGVVLDRYAITQIKQSGLATLIYFTHVLTKACQTGIPGEGARKLFCSKTVPYSITAVLAMV